MKNATTDCEDGEEDGPVYQFRRIGSAATCKGVKDEFKVSTSTTKIGRQLDEVDFYLNSTVNKRLISRQHAQLERIHDGKQWRFILIDTSLNGTYVNDVKVSGQTELKVGDTVTFGHTNGINVRDGMVAWQPNSEFRFVFECVYSQGRTYVRKAPSQNSSLSSAEAQAPPFFQEQTQSQEGLLSAQVKTETIQSAQVKPEPHPPALPTRHSAMDSVKQAFTEAAVEGVQAKLEDMAARSGIATPAHWMTEKLMSNQGASNMQQSKYGPQGGGDIPLASTNSQRSPSRGTASNRTPQRQAAVNRGGVRDVYDFEETDEQKREHKVVKKMSSSPASNLFQHQPTSHGPIAAGAHSAISDGTPSSFVPAYVSKPMPSMMGSNLGQDHSQMQQQVSAAIKFPHQLQNLAGTPKGQLSIAQLQNANTANAPVAHVQFSSDAVANSKLSLGGNSGSKQLQSQAGSASKHGHQSPGSSQQPSLSLSSLSGTPEVYIHKPIPGPASTTSQFNHSFNAPHQITPSQITPSQIPSTQNPKMAPVASVVPQPQLPTSVVNSASGQSNMPPNTMKVEPFSKAEQDKRLNKPTQKVSPVSVDKSRARKVEKDREIISSWINNNSSTTPGSGRKTLTSLNSDLGYLSRLSVDGDAIQTVAPEEPSPTTQKTLSPVKVKPEKVSKSESVYNSSTNRTENTMEEIRALFSSVKRPSALSKDASSPLSKTEKKDKVFKQHIPTSATSRTSDDEQEDSDDDEDEDETSSSGDDSEAGSTSSSSEHTEQRSSMVKKPIPTSVNNTISSKSGKVASQKKQKHAMNPSQSTKVQFHPSQIKTSTSPQKVSANPSKSSAHQSSKVSKKKAKVISKKKSVKVVQSSKRKPVIPPESAKSGINRKRKQSSSSSSSSDSDNSESADESEEETAPVHDQRKRTALASSNAKKKSHGESKNKRNVPHVSFKERKAAAAAAAVAAAAQVSQAKKSGKKTPKATTPNAGASKSKKIVYYQEETCDSPDCLKPSGSTIDWVQCDDCDLWFHTVCVGCNLEVVQKVNASFHCGCV